jgi:hypothetical protein
MPARHLPAAPSLEHLRKQAKELLHGVRAGDPAAVALVREHHPRVADGAAEPATLTLADAQLVVARQHGDPLASVEDPTPLGWARHADRHQVADYLAGLDPARR